MFQGPKGKELEAGHRQLGDLVAHGCPSRLLDGTAGILDGVIIKFSKDLDGREEEQLPTIDAGNVALSMVSRVNELLTMFAM